MPDLEQDEKDERHEKRDQGGGIDGDDVGAVLQIRTRDQLPA